MKALLVLAAVAGTAFVGYSYTSTDGKSCAVCPLSGKPLMTSGQSECGCCANKTDAVLTSSPSDKAPCCSEGACQKHGEQMLTLTEAPACAACAGEHGVCELMLTEDGEDNDTVFDLAGPGTETASPEASSCEEGCTKGCCSGNKDVVMEEVTTEEVATEETAVEEVSAEETK